MNKEKVPFIKSFFSGPPTEWIKIIITFLILLAIKWVGGTWEDAISWAFLHYWVFEFLLWRYGLSIIYKRHGKIYKYRQKDISDEEENF